MNIGIWIAFAAGVVIAGAPITQGGIRKIDEKAFRKYINKRGLPLPPALREPLLSRLRLQERAALTCAWVGMALGALLAILLENFSGSEATFGVLALVGAALGSSIGGFVAVMRRREDLVPDAPRVARASETTVGDYLTGQERLAYKFTPVAVALSVAVAWITWAMVPVQTAALLLTMGVATGVAVSMLVLWALVMPASRALLERPQHAHTDLELAWDDATRTDALRGLQESGIVAPFVSLVAVAGFLLGSTDLGGDRWLGAVAALAGIVCWLPVAILFLMGRAVANPSRGLWRGRSFAEGSQC